MHVLKFDIETFGEKPTLKELNAAIKANGNCKTAKSRKENIKKQQDAIMDDPAAAIEAAWRANSLDKFKSIIIALSYQLDDGPIVKLKGSTTLTVHKDITDEDELLIRKALDIEQDILEDLNKVITGLKSEANLLYWVHWNGSEFDLPILGLRALKYRHTTLFNAMPNNEKDKRNVDLMKRITPTIWKSFHSMKSICEYLGIPCKEGDIDGSKVHDYFRAGKHDEISDYCGGDVEVLGPLSIRLGCDHFYERTF